MKRRKTVTGALFALIVASSNVAIAGGFDSISVFGDSISDQGNLFAVTGIPRTDHYGGPLDVYGNPPFPGRFSNGRNYVDFLAEWLNVPTAPSLLGGTNFAFGGARTDYNIVEDDMSKPDQAVWYGAIIPGVWLDHGGILPAGALPWTLNAESAVFDVTVGDVSGALCIVVSGSNDFRDFLVMAGTNLPAFGGLYYAPGGYRDNVLDGITGAIQDFKDHGARDMVIVNIPNLGVVPATLQQGGAAAAAAAAALIVPFNETLEGTLDDLEASDDFIDNDVNIIQVDAYSLLTDLVNNHDAHGFSNASDPCYTGFVGPSDNGDECPRTGDLFFPDDHVFWDKEHVTTAAHAVVATAVLEKASLDMLYYLKGQVSRLDVSDPVRNSLNEKLDGAIQSLNDGNSSNDQAAVKKLKDFIKIVTAKQGKQIPEDAADSMTMRAEKVISLVDALVEAGA